MASDTAGLIEGLGLAPCHYVGWSMGGAFGEELLANRPGLIASATLMGCARPVTTYARLFVEAAAEMAAAGQLLPPAMTESFFFGAMFTAAQRQDDTLVQTFHDRMAAIPPWAGPGTHGQLTALVGGSADEAYRQWWPRIGRPVLVVSFTDDDRFPPSHGEAMTAAIPGARHVVIDGAAHGGPITHGAQVAAHLVASLGYRGGCRRVDTPRSTRRRRVASPRCGHARPGTACRDGPGRQSRQPRRVLLTDSAAVQPQCGQRSSAYAPGAGSQSKVRGGAPPGVWSAPPEWRPRGRPAARRGRWARQPDGVRGSAGSRRCSCGRGYVRAGERLRPGTTERRDAPRRWCRGCGGRAPPPTRNRCDGLHGRSTGLAGPAPHDRCLRCAGLICAAPAPHTTILCVGTLATRLNRARALSATSTRTSHIAHRLGGARARGARTRPDHGRIRTTRQTGVAGSSGWRQRSPGYRAKPRSAECHRQPCSITIAAR